MDQDNKGDGGEQNQEPVGDTMHSNMHDNVQEEKDTQEEMSDNINDHKLYAILGYILPFLFFLPLVQESSKHDAFARFHANQQLILLIIWIGLYILSNMFYAILMMGAFLLMPLLNLAVLVLAILGIINAVHGEMKELPIVGGFKLLK